MNTPGYGMKRKEFKISNLAMLRLIFHGIVDTPPKDFPIQLSLLNLFLTISEVYFKINQAKEKRDE
jgi:hypothetical protein